MEEYSYTLKIPIERVAVLIGKKGEVKTDLESNTKTKIDVNSKEGEVKITGTDPILLYNLREIITAIGRGFNPDVAKLLLKVDYALEIISMQEYTRSKNDMIRLKGRVIGNEGKSRKTIEDLTECQLSVYGKTISMIGTCEQVPLAKRAIESLLQGSPHSNVFKWLETQRKTMREEHNDDFIKDEFKKFK